MHCVVWQYEVEETQQLSFEKEYGVQGAWAQLFSTSVHFKGSQLSKDVNKRHTYVVLDYWEDAASYHAFLAANEVAYTGLSKQLKGLYVKENRGHFESNQLH